MFEIGQEVDFLGKRAKILYIFPDNLTCEIELLEPDINWPDYSKYVTTGIKSLK